MDQLQVGSLVIGILGGLLGTLGGYRVILFALERRLDERYPSRKRHDELAVQVEVAKSDLHTMEGRMAKAEQNDALVLKDLQYITTHINERVLTTLESITEELREMRRDQSMYSKVQERHTVVMEQHSQSLKTFQDWVARRGSSPEGGV